MFKIEEESLKRLTNKLRLALGERLKYVIAFGSRVRGDFTADSDFDILIVIEKPDLNDEIRTIRIVSEEEDKTGIPYVPVVKSLEVFKKEKEFKTGFYQNLKQEGVFFYDTE